MFTERTLLSKSGNYPVSVLPCCSGTIPSPEPAFPGCPGMNAVRLTVSRSRSLPGLQLGAGSRNAGLKMKVKAVSSCSAALSGAGRFAAFSPIPIRTGIIVLIPALLSSSGKHPSAALCASLALFSVETG